MKKLALMLVVVLVCSMMFAACGNAASSAVTSTAGSSAAPAGEATELSVCTGPNPDTIDPALNSAVDGATMIIHAFEGLYTLDENGTPTPGQAESVDVSEDGLTYTFHLRDGLKWSDGEALKASDFVYSWNRAINPDTAADYEYMFDCIDGYADGALNVVAEDDQTLVVTLVAKTPYFLELTAFPAYSPVREDIITEYGEAWAIEAATYIGNGPYKVTEWVDSSYIMMEKNENYWNYDALGADKIKFVLMEDDAAQLTAYKSGELDFIDAVPQDEIDALSANSDFYKAGQLGTYYVCYNVNAAPFDDPLVRQAFTLAVDRNFIVTQIGKSGQVEAGAFVPIGLTDSDATKEFREVGGDYYDPSAAANEANLAKAKELLAEAGYADGKGLPTITYLYNEGTGHQAIGEALQSMWEQLGATVTLESQEWATFLNTRKNGDYQVARNGWLGDYNDPISFLDMWVTDGGNNDAQYSNADYDAIIRKVKASGDAAERMTLMHEAEDLIMGQDWVLCPVYYYVDIYMMKDNVSGAWSSPLGFKYFMYATKA